MTVQTSLLESIDSIESKENKNLVIKDLEGTKRSRHKALRNAKVQVGRGVDASPRRTQKKKSAAGHSHTQHRTQAPGLPSDVGESEARPRQNGKGALSSLVSSPLCAKIGETPMANQ